ncbi:MAG: DUF262 domain-containing protein [Muribaculaceae bacterium]|nr:DUF262 domain-containing protein [Muribaculaceae bacterium]
MKANQQRIWRLFNQQGIEFIIPIYQRNYDWKEEQCIQLLNDILELGKSDQNDSHFIGSIVYISDNFFLDENKYVIIDGQQRITTLTLLLIALYKSYKKSGNTAIAEEIYEDYIINKRSSDPSKLKLKATADNSQDMNALLYERPISNEFSRIKNNYNFFEREINEENRNIIWDGFKKLYFVEISLERGKDNPQKIFESLNSTGLDLSQGDLIRNYILMGLQPEQQNLLYKKFWEPIERNTTLNNQSHISNFIRDYLTLKTGEIPRKDKVYNVFKRYHHIGNVEDLEKMLSEIYRFSEIYKFFLDPNLIKEDEIKQALTYLNYIEVNVAYPFLLQLFDDFNKNIINKEAFLSILKFILTYVTRRFILDLPTNALNKVFMVLPKQIDYENYEESLYKYILTRPGKSRMPTDLEIQNGLAQKDLYNSHSRMLKYILENIENYNNKEKVHIIDEGQITIEHIFPQNPDVSWRSDINEEDYSEFSTKYLHTLGNLTLSGNNGKLGNKSFIEKRDMNKNGGEQGYKYSRLWINRDLKEFSIWDIANYKKRAEQLSERFLKIWNLPKIENIIDIPEINIDELTYDKTLKLEYALYKGNKVIKESLSKLYDYIIEDLFTEDEESFISRCSSIIKLTPDISKLRRPGTVNNYFYEKNLSGDDIFENLKKILDKLGKSDDLYLKFRRTII